MRYILGIIICLTCCSVHAQVFQNVYGKVTDAATEQELIAATVKITDLNGKLLGAITDLNGEYLVEEISIGRINLEASYLGYEPIKITGLELTSARALEVNIELIQSAQNLGIIEVIAMPDKSGTNNEIIIRGNSSAGLQWRMEDIEIPNPNHFTNGIGSTGGGISIINHNVLNNSDFYSGAFPAEYGQALSGIFDLKLREGNKIKNESSIFLGVMGLNFFTEGPIGQNKKSSYIVNYRYSSLALLDQLLDIKIGGENATPPPIRTLILK